MSVRSAVPLLVLALLAGACQTNPLTGENEVNFYSARQEQSLGYDLAPQIEDEIGGVYEDPALQDYVNGLTRRIAGEAPVQEGGVRFRYRGRVLNSPVVNAFSLPGGPVYITRGLLVRLRSEAELAGVLGHEVAHIAGRHGTNRISEAQLTQALFTIGIVAASASVDKNDRRYVGAAATVASAIGVLYLLGHSRDHEYQADEFGAEFAWRTEYDPRALADVFRTFKQVKREMGAPNTPEFMQTHPKDDNRIRELERIYGQNYAEPPPGKAYRTDPKDFKNAVSGLERDEEALKLYDRAKGLMGQKRKEWARAILLLDDSIKRAPDYSFSYVARGICLSNLGRGEQARKDFARAVERNPNNGRARRLYGAVLAATGDSAAAEQQFREAIALNTLDTDARRGLAVMLETRGKRREAKRERALVLQIRQGQDKGIRIRLK